MNQKTFSTPAAIRGGWKRLPESAHFLMEESDRDGAAGSVSLHRFLLYTAQNRCLNRWKR